MDINNQGDETRVYYKIKGDEVVKAESRGEKASAKEVMRMLSKELASGEVTCKDFTSEQKKKWYENKREVAKTLHDQYTKYNKVLFFFKWIFTKPMNAWKNKFIEKVEAKIGKLNEQKEQPPQELFKEEKQPPPQLDEKDTEKKLVIANPESCKNCILKWEKQKDLALLSECIKENPGVFAMLSDPYVKKCIYNRAEPNQKKQLLNEKQLEEVDQIILGDVANKNGKCQACLEDKNLCDAFDGDLLLRCVEKNYEFIKGAIQYMLIDQGSESRYKKIEYLVNNLEDKIQTQVISSLLFAEEGAFFRYVLKAKGFDLNSDQVDPGPIVEFLLPYMKDVNMDAEAVLSLVSEGLPSNVQETLLPEWLKEVTDSNKEEDVVKRIIKKEGFEAFAKYAEPKLIAKYIGEGSFTSIPVDKQEFVFKALDDESQKNLLKQSVLTSDYAVFKVLVNFFEPASIAPYVGSGHFFSCLPEDKKEAVMHERLSFLVKPNEFFDYLIKNDQRCWLWVNNDEYLYAIIKLALENKKIDAFIKDIDKILSKSEESHEHEESHEQLKKMIIKFPTILQLLPQQMKTEHLISELKKINNL